MIVLFLSITISTARDKEDLHKTSSISIPCEELHTAPAQGAVTQITEES